MEYMNVGGSVMSKEQTNNRIGEVRIADDVVAVIAAIAATETKGVHSMAGNITNELVAKLGVRNISKGVKIVMEGNSVCVDVALIAEYGCSIPKMSVKVQEKIVQAIETMTGLNVVRVNVRIAGVSAYN